MKTTLWILIVIAIVLFTVIAVISYIMVGIIMNRKNQGFAKFGHAMANPDIVQTSDDPYRLIEDKQNEAAKPFWDSHLTETIYRESFDGLKLFASVFNSNPDSKKWFIGVHGYRSTGRRDMQVIVHHLVSEGYNALIPDQRAHGKSEGETITMGYKESKDFIEWTNWLLEREPDAEIILFGDSMGATTSMLTIGSGLPENVKGAVFDCGYTSAYLEFQSLFKRVLKLPEYPIMPLVNLFTKLRAKYNLKDTDVRPGLEKNKLPTLFIHGTADSFVPHDMSYINIDATKGKKELVLVENAPHFSSYIYDEKLYFESVNNFLNDNVWGE
jgi:X-Pro dipeptidyl-peptidase (S15 family).